MLSINATRPLEPELLKPLPLQFLNQLREYFERVVGNNIDPDVVETARENLLKVEHAVISKRGAA